MARPAAPDRARRAARAMPRKRRVLAGRYDPFCNRSAAVKPLFLLWLMSQVDPQQTAGLTNPLIFDSNVNHEHLQEADVDSSFVAGPRGTAEN